MKRVTVPALALLAFLATGPAHAVTEQNFNVDTTADLVALCSADAKEAMGTAALNFCHGFVVGSARVMQVNSEASRNAKLFCLPQPMPTRDQSVGEFVKWAQADQVRMGSRPYDALYAFLRERFPCKRAK